MSKKTVALSVDEQVYEKYRGFCEKNGWILSKQFENFMIEQIKRNSVKND